MTGYTFNPGAQTVTMSGADTPGVDFTAQSVGSATISGTISPTSGGAGATVILGGAASATTTTDANGNYSFTGLANGSYTVSPTETGYSFIPTTQAVTLSGASQGGVNFTAQGTDRGVSREPSARAAAGAPTFSPPAARKAATWTGLPF